MWPLSRRPPAPEGRQIGTPSHARTSPPVPKILGNQVAVADADDTPKVPTWREIWGGLRPHPLLSFGISADEPAWAAPREPEPRFSRGGQWYSRVQIDEQMRVEDPAAEWARVRAESSFGQPRLISGPLGVMGRDWVLDPGQEV
jgi:hypothetical protein